MGAGSGWVMASPPVGGSVNIEKPRAERKAHFERMMATAATGRMHPDTPGFGFRSEVNFMWLTNLSTSFLNIDILKYDICLESQCGTFPPRAS